jgi:DNA-binding transcriptional LysR family regulator
MDIQDLRIFVRVAALQNLSAVGTELNLTPGTISKRIQALEDEMTVRLFDRTTRSIRITDEGTIFLGAAERMLGELDQVQAIVGENIASPKGRIKLSAPASIGSFMAPALSAFMRAYPQIEVHADLTDRLVNLQEEGYDLALRMGVLSDSTLKAKRLTVDHQVIVASPGYIAKAGMPKAPDDLAGACLVLGDTNGWSFQVDDQPIVVRVSGPLRSDNGELLHQAALDGHGFVRMSALKARPDLKAGRLVRVLAGFDVTANAAIWAVYPGSKHQLPKLRALLDFLANWFRDANPGAGADGRDVPADDVVTASGSQTADKTADNDTVPLARKTRELETATRARRA